MLTFTKSSINEKTKFISPCDPMWASTVQHQNVGVVPARALTIARRSPKFPSSLPKSPGTFRFDIRFRVSKSKVWAAKKQLNELETREPGHWSSTLITVQFICLWLI
jgi:hypothetical protein